MLDKSLALFCDGESIALQDRGSYSKYGEKYGFWGGSIESGESPEEALRRELLEELSYTPKVLNFWQDYSFELNEEHITLHLFISDITKVLMESKVKEGSGMIIFKLKEILKNKDFDEVDRDIISKLVSHFKNNSKN